MTTANIPPLLPSLLLSNKCKKEKKKRNTRIGSAYYKSLYADEFPHAKVSECVCICMFECLLMQACAQVCVDVCVCLCVCVCKHMHVFLSVCVCVCVTENRGDSLTPLRQGPNTSKPQTIYANPARSLKSTSFTFSLHFSNKY